MKQESISEFVKELAKEFWQKEFNLSNKEVALYFFLMYEFERKRFKSLVFSKQNLSERFGIDENEVSKCLRNISDCNLIEYDIQIMDIKNYKGFSYNHPDYTIRVIKKLKRQ